MQALITGGAGFIGSHLAEALLERGDEVHIIDDLSTGNIRNLDHLRDNKRLHVTIDQVENVPVLAELVDRSDVVFHLAAAVGVRLVVESPVRTIETNLKTTELVLAQASKKQKKVFFASTSEVYGKREKQPCLEDDDLIIGSTQMGRWSYACSKAMDEFLALAYAKERGLPVIVARFFNTVGPRQTGRYGMVVPNFVRQAISGENITVYGDGNQARCFGYVGDVVGAVMKLVDTPAAYGGVFNIGNETELSINELAERVIRLAGSSSKIQKIPYSEAYGDGFEDMRRRVPDLTKVRNLIGYRPRISVDEIIEKVIAYQRANP
jgi:UDP-glucose 4-epimerase